MTTYHCENCGRKMTAEEWANYHGDRTMVLIPSRGASWRWRCGCKDDAGLFVRLDGTGQQASFRRPLDADPVDP